MGIVRRESVVRWGNRSKSGRPKLSIRNQALHETHPRLLALKERIEAANRLIQGSTEVISTKMLREFIYQGKNQLFSS